MEKKKLHIGQGRIETFLVWDKSLNDVNAPFRKWLSKEGFRFAGYKGCFSICFWYHVNITRKESAYGMPFIGFSETIGNHAITLDEFMEIYNIYKKYEGKSLFDFSDLQDVKAPTLEEVVAEEAEKGEETPKSKNPLRDWWNSLTRKDE